MAARCDETMGDNKAYLPLRIGYLPDSIVARAEKELGETEEAKARAFPEMRELISREPNFTCPTDDDYLLQFLRPRKFDVNRGFELLQASWEVKRRFGHLYDVYDRESLMKAFGLKCMFCLPYRDEEGAAIFIVKMKNWDPDVCTADEFMTALTIVCFACAFNPMTQVCGIRLLIDVGGMYLKQARRLTTTFFLIIANALKATMPARWVGIHIYNETVLVPMMWVFFKRLLSEKLRSRVYFHGAKTEELHKYFPKEVLPDEYGGDSKDDVAAWYNSEVVESFLLTYKDMLKYGYSK